MSIGIQQTQDWLSCYVNRQAKVTRAIDELDVAKFAGLLWGAFKERRRILVIGNGGSAANASHFAVDLGKGASDALCAFIGSKDRRFRVESLADNTPWLTAISNDYEYADVFSQRIDSICGAGDILVGISVSGTSPNLYNAFSKAGKMGMTRVALTRKTARGKLDSIANECELHIGIDSEEYGIVEDAEMTTLHAVCYYFMENASALAKEIV